ncbi:MULTISPECIES: C40 family peptidase [unclassified Synechococcus]|uniref:C40 family peptidase n=1 Tax=unclassified Synechococcus TaxID=2626047 RepID=UPI000DB26D0D|nr:MULTISPECIES: C40 family peptidase [unclassified Synechococcus]PZV06268.1 MAG: hydrolase [Cyanobium sp.]
MQRLGTQPQGDRGEDLPTPGTPAAPDLLLGGSCWRLTAELDGYSGARGQGLATQASAGRRLQVLEPAGSIGRLRVRLLEDGYPCWLERRDLLGAAVASRKPLPRLLDSAAITAAIPAVIGYANQAASQPNRYLWGGTTGPDFDCSGLVQSAYASTGIWIPRDAYQQERFCQPVAVRPGSFSLLRPGDLIFFGRPQRCTHVALYLGEGRYLHSSGREHGHDGLAINQLTAHDQDPVGRHYRNELRGAGRVVRCHDGTTLP